MSGVTSRGLPEARYLGYVDRSAMRWFRLDSHVHPCRNVADGSCPHPHDGENRGPMTGQGLAHGSKAWPSPGKSTAHPQSMVQRAGSYFHLHLVSDSTGETLATVARAATAQYAKVQPV